MKEVGLLHWETPNEGANNSSGFLSLPGGERSSNFDFIALNGVAIYWSSTGVITSPHTYINYYSNAFLSQGTSDKNDGHSVRCVKD